MILYWIWPKLWLAEKGGDWKALGVSLHLMAKRLM